MDHLFLNQIGYMIPTAQIRVHRGSHEISQCTHDGSRAHVPAPKAGMRCTHGIRQDGFQKFLIGGVSPGWVLGRSTLEAFCYLVWNRLPNRAFACCFEIRDGIVYHAVCEGAHLVPVFGVEGFIWFIHSYLLCYSWGGLLGGRGVISYKSDPLTIIL